MPTYAEVIKSVEETLPLLESKLREQKKIMEEVRANKNKIILWINALHQLKRCITQNASPHRMRKAERRIQELPNISNLNIKESI